MPQAAMRDVATMRDSVLFDGVDAGRKQSRFWLLLILAAVIAASGVIADSEATVIGAMIVAPLRVPILGTMLAIVLGDRINLQRSLGLMVGGALATVGVGFVIGLTVAHDITSRTNDQVASWSHAGLIDLVAALAVGVVGSVALVRNDIADALPGVAIAISLVPPLTVVGLTLESGSYDEAGGAALLFLTNVAAILAVGVIVMRIYHIRGLAQFRSDGQPVVNRLKAYWMIGLLLVVVFGLLAQASWSAGKERGTEVSVASVLTVWGDENGLELVDIQSTRDGVIARLEGPPPLPDTSELGSQLRAAGVDPAEVELELVPRVNVAFDD